LDADLFVVVAYGEILKQNILDLPRSGAINVHASLLPKYRGAAPMQRCLMDGCKETGVTIMNMVLEMDAGDMLKTVTLPIPEEMTRGELEERLWELSAPALVQVIQEIENGSVKKTAQNPAQVTFAPKIKPEEEEIHWSAPATKIHNQIRGLSPAPGAWCFTKVGEEKKRLKIKRSKVVREMSGKPGQILVQDKKQLIVACGENALSLIEVQLEGKKSLPIGDFLRGLQETLHFV
jgi:methionyl-tRNA formyltransferase